MPRRAESPATTAESALRPAQVVHTGRVRGFAARLIDLVRVRSARVECQRSIGRVSKHGIMAHAILPAAMLSIYT